MIQVTENMFSHGHGPAIPMSRTRAASIVATIAAVLLATLYVLTSAAFAGKYDTDAWGGKFRYGAYSTLISSHVLGWGCRHEVNSSCGDLIELLNDPNAELEGIKEKIKAFKARYETLTDKEIDEIIDFARRDQTPSIYEEERSVVSTIEQNDAFNHGMAGHPLLAPVDGMVKEGRFENDNFQFSVHRALYNDAYGIPQNSLAAIVNAYVAGIRNVEFDVLDTRDNVSILIHDLVTNRLEGKYMDHPKYVEDQSYDHVKDTAVSVLIPTGDQPAVEDTRVKMITTERVLEVVHELMPEMTLYLDARNNAPLSIINLLKLHPEYKDNVVLKIYPFLLSGGMTDLVKRYADRYTSGYEKGARDEIASINPNVLLAIGHAEMEANQDAAHSGINDFTWTAFQEQTQYLPFSLNSNLFYTHFNNEPIFTPQELNEIEMRTFLLFRWTVGLTGITNTLVFQMAAIPSLVDVIEKSRDQDTVAGALVEFAEMAKQEKGKRVKENMISAATHDNFIALYKMVMRDQLVFAVDGCVNETCNLRDRIAHTRFGLSDRYPDFAFAERETQNGNADTVKQDTLQSFNYSMLGTGYKSEGYQPEKVRSTRAIMDRIEELNKITGSHVIYITTDLEIDLRLAFMGLLGQVGLPDDIKHRAGGVIKEGVPINSYPYSVPLWLTRLSGEKHGNYPDRYKSDYEAISKEQKSIDQLQQIHRSLQRTFYDNLPVTNMDAWHWLNINKVATRDELETENIPLEYIINQIDGEITKQQQSVQQLKRTFEQNYGVRFVGERGIESQE